MPKCVIEKGELVIASQRRKPQRELGEIDGHLILVHAIQALLSNQPACVEQLIFIRGQDRCVVMLMPCLDQASPS